MLLRSRRRLVACYGVLAVIIVVAALLPQSTVVSRPLTLQFITNEGGPISGIGVRQEWLFYGLGGGHHHADAVSDSDGKITFPERSILGRRGEKFVSRIFSAVNVHGSYGPSVSFVIKMAAHSEIDFAATGFNELQPFVTSGSYVDKYGRNLYPRESETGLYVFLRGDFLISDGSIRIVVKKNPKSEGPLKP